MAGYNWLLTPASIFEGHYLKQFYSKFENILKDSLSLLEMSENTFFEIDYFLFTIAFKKVYTNISVKDAMKIMKKLFFRYQNFILNTHFIIELMEMVLNCAIMKFQEDVFMQILGIVMGTNLAPMLTDIYMAILDKELSIICTEKNITWPKMFKRSTDDEFGVIKSNKNNFWYWLLNLIAFAKTSS